MNLSVDSYKLLTNCTIETPSNEKVVVEPAEITTLLESHPWTETKEMASQLNSSPLEAVHEEPEHDFYEERTFQNLVLCLLFALISTTIIVLFVPEGLTIQGSKYTKGKQLLRLLPSVNFLGWRPSSIMTGAVVFNLCSLFFKTLPAGLVQARSFVVIYTLSVHGIVPLFLSGDFYIMIFALFCRLVRRDLHLRGCETASSLTEH